MPPEWRWGGHLDEGRRLEEWRHTSSTDRALAPPAPERPSMSVGMGAEDGGGEVRQTDVIHLSVHLSDLLL